MRSASSLSPAAAADNVAASARPRRRALSEHDWAVLKAIRRSFYVGVVVFVLTSVLFAVWRNPLLEQEEAEAAAAVAALAQHQQQKQQLEPPSNPLLTFTVHTNIPLSVKELEDDDDDDEDYDDDDDVEELEDVDASTNNTAKERPPREIEEEIVLVHLPDPYEKDQEEMAWSLLDLQDALDQVFQAKLFLPIEERLQAVEERLGNMLNRPTILTSTTDVKTMVQVEALRELLSVVSLSDLSDEMVEDIFWRARDELFAIMANNATVPWNLIEAVVNQEYSRTKPDDDDNNNNNNTLAGGCRVPVLSDLNQSLARDTDLARQVADVERWLQGISQDVLQTSALRARQRQWEQTITQLATQAKAERNVVLAHEIQEKNRGQNCISQEQVLDMVDEGLAVLQQHSSNGQALRAMLEQKTKALEPEAQVILDAIFLPTEQQHHQRRSSSWLASTLTSSSSINLRRILDTPLLSQQVPLWLDGFEKMIGGHLDVVDDVLDWLIQQPPPPSLSATTTTTSSGSSKITVGHLVVAHLLELAGKVNITIPNVLRELPRRQQPGI